VIQQTEGLAQTVGLTAACAALSVSRSRVYRARHPVLRAPAPASRSFRALPEAEKEQIRGVLNSARFQDQAPREVYATLLDEGQYLCHWRSMYRILAENQAIRERRNQLRHPVYVKPELLATGPNQVWSWDITKLRGPVKWVYFYLYVLLDIFSRYVVGWLLAECESGALAEQLIAESCAKQKIARGQLTIHADNGGPMIAKTVAQLMVDLEVTESHSRPHVSDDNPYSEAQFKTLKYAPSYPDRFADYAMAQSWARHFFAWYNTEHHHSALGLLTPAAVHSGAAAQLLGARQHVLTEAYLAHPERFVQGPPVPTALPAAVWINPPKEPKGGAVPQASSPAPAGVDMDDLH
jgi:putative transposase